MHTGLNNSPSIFPSKPKAAGFASRAVNEQYSVILANTGVPQPCPASVIQPGAQVSIRGQAGNAANVRFGMSREAVMGTQGYAVTADTEVFCPVDKGNQIWVAGTAGDVALVSVRRSGA